MERKSVNLALQGGGAHGAFTWGVLDRLLDEHWLEIAGVSGTSAGALNGAALKAGLGAHGGRAGRMAAKENLDRLWSEIGMMSDNRVVRWTQSLMPMNRSMQRWTEMFSPAAWLDNLTRIFSPYDYGPFYSNPLGPLLQGLPHSNYACDGGPELFIAATNVRTGRIRVFSGRETSVDAIIASACLPTMFQAVEIADPATGRVEAYWDGGFTGNPALFPLYAARFPRDIVIVAINPLMRDVLPRSPVEIADRVNEISFNSSLMAQLRSINFVKKLFDEGRMTNRSMKNVLIHLIDDDKLMNDLNARSKVMPKPGLLESMKSAGQVAADVFLQDHADKLNRTDSFDLQALFANYPA
ncbi:patatin-like phospholipase family protein [Paracoccus sp. 1_MG-2023]|uniref:patatin-like phospholipase family protein n=1 Tax=unclassified Paracoccus (in: a-proteobacteria) TaxID=2688777 RepID=UPI001C089ED0|nr:MULTISPECIES: patatin-like phospholipase family protein [unclassified Paracoccus (in: a-proteobacteria)]MBU2958584.1 patatin-like phospholipase family protein [Paracoccus sp. C2R09]MDO6667577.1 patatin-like phospholipase family protein [Paracoccus sp. 1_MG-2023]